MNMMPGPRTNPTVKQSPAMNKRNLRYMEIRLGLIQLTVLLGAVLGSMTCAFMLGYHSGQKVGFENALASTQANLARMPVGMRRDKKSSAKQESAEVYAKLKQRAGDGLAKELPTELDGADSDVPELGAIKDVRELPVAEVETTTEEALAKVENQDSTTKTDLDALLEVEQLDQAPAKQERHDTGDSVVRVLGEPALTAALAKEDSSKTKTLGALLADKKPAEIADSKTQAKNEIEAPHSDLIRADTDTKVEAVSARASLAAQEVKKQTQLAANQQNTKKISDQSGPSASGSLARKPSESVAPAKVKTVANNLRKGWFAQVAAPKKRADADALASSLKGSGFSVSIETANVRGEEYFRVLVGPEDNREQAERMVSQLSREKYVKGAPFIRLIK